MKNITKLFLVIASCIGITLYSSENRFISEEVRKNTQSMNQGARNYDLELAQITAKAYITTGRQVPKEVIMDLDSQYATTATHHNRQLQVQLHEQQPK